MNYNTPVFELNSRMKRFCELMDEQNPGWKMAIIFSKINLFYFTGTFSEGMLVIERNKGSILWVRRSFDRALSESGFEHIKPMNGYRDAASGYHSVPDEVYLEVEYVPLAMLDRVRKYFPFKTYKSCDLQIAITRAVKSAWELQFMRQAGEIHRHIFEGKVPFLLREGISEADLTAELYELMVKEGHQGVARFSMHDTEIAVAQLGFGESSLMPTNFDGPGGNRGLYAAVPAMGSRERLLKKGDLVFIDMALGVNGYHSDKTMTFMFGGSPSEVTMEVHKQCIEVQNRIADLLIPGNIPEVIYETVMESLSPEFQKDFMGYGNRQVKFLGHGIGLNVDEWPVIAKGFKMPLQENMVFAIEPKKGIKDIGMVGIENTFIVTPDGGQCISGNNTGLIPVLFK